MHSIYIWHVFHLDVKKCVLVFFLFVHRCERFKTLGSNHNNHFLQAPFLFMPSESSDLAFCLPFKKWTKLSKKNSVWSLCLFLRCLREHTVENVYDVVQSPQVAILPVALHPGTPVVQGLRFHQGNRLPKVDHPHFGLSRGIMHKEQRAAHNLSETNRRRQMRMKLRMRCYHESAIQTTGLSRSNENSVNVCVCGSHLMCLEKVRLLKD